MPVCATCCTTAFDLPFTPTQSISLYRAYRFFHAHAAGIVGQRALNAWQLATAEAWASDHDMDFVWTWDSEGAMDEPPDTDVLGCECLDPETGETLASLWAILDPSDAYRRVIEAELALAAMATHATA